MSTKPPERLQEFQFIAEIDHRKLPAFLRALREFAGGFHEHDTEKGTCWVVGLVGGRGRQRLKEFLRLWAGRTRARKVHIASSASQRGQIYFLLPLQRNPGPRRVKRTALFTNERLKELWGKLAGLGFRLQAVSAYGEWLSEDGTPIPDYHFLVRVARRNRATAAAVRRFIREEILGHPSCDQESVYLSVDGWGEFVYPKLKGVA